MQVRNAYVLTVRPKVAELSFQLFGRALHPELFETHKTRTIERGEYEVKVDVTSRSSLDIVLSSTSVQRT